jgi:3-dehydroshikimate dehydratase
MIRLSAFADEISADLNEQIEVLEHEQIHFIDLRSVWGINVLSLSDEQLDEIKRTLQAHKIVVAAIASPIGKVPIDFSFEAHLQQFERAIVAAQHLETVYIRIFSFYPPTSQPNADPNSYRTEVLQRLGEFTRLAQAAGLTLIHENEKEIYGDSIARNVDLLQSISSPHLRSALDPANYLQCQQIPYPDAYEATLPWLDYVHVKDVRADGTLVPAGEGEGHWPEILDRLRKDNYDGFLALEPHLSAAGQFQGFSGPTLFQSASQALQNLLRTMEWKYA